MVRLILSALIGTCLIGVAQTRAQEFPYVAFVSVGDAYVRSGPGQKYYPTQQLQQGFAVEVYRHDSEGWCAIRPPEGSFSWVPAHQVRYTDRTIGEVAADGVVTRIGSDLSSARSTVQVLMPRGERVEIFPNAATDSPGWLRIAAPSGEFRWISSKQLSLEPPLEAATPLPSSPRGMKQVMQPQGAFQHLRVSGGQRVGVVPIQPAVQTIGGLTFGAPQRAAVASYESVAIAPEAIEVVAGSPADVQMRQNPTASQLGTSQFGAMPIAAGLSSSPRIRFRSLSEADKSTVERIGELQLRLSQTVTQSPQEWHFEQLQAEATQLLEKAESPQIRSQLRDLLDRVTQFQQVRQGYEESAVEKAFEERLAPVNQIGVNQTAVEQSAVVEESIEPAVEGLTGMSLKIRAMAKQDLKAPATKLDSEGYLDRVEPLYDAVGLLKPVTSKRATAPQYALVDGKGDVVSFLTPTPDLNLQPYLGRRIGVHGERGFMPEYRRAHVTVARVSQVDGSTR